MLVGDTLAMPAPAGSQVGASALAVPSPPLRSRWFDVGHSNAVDPTVAGTEAAKAALTGPDPALMIVFASARYRLDALVDAAAKVAPGVPMAGCTTAGEIASGNSSSGGVAIVMLGGPGISATTAITPDASKDLYNAGVRAAGVCASAPGRPHRLLLLLSDGLIGDQQDVVRGAYSQIGAGVGLAGGAAGDDSFMERTHQICDGRVVSDSIVSVEIGSDAPIGVGVGHGWTPEAGPMTITRSEGTEVLEIDGVPALEAYLGHLGAPLDLADDRATFVEFAGTHPLGLRQHRSERVRWVSGCNPARGSLVMAAGVPVGQVVWLMKGDSESILAGTAESFGEAVDSLDSHDPLGVLIFDCVARRSVMSGVVTTEQDRLLCDRFGSTPTAGFITYGEFGRPRGVHGFHHQTLVSVAFA